MKTVKAVLMFEKDAPKTRAFGTRTKDGILIKVWVPKDMIKAKDTLAVVLDMVSGKKGKVVEDEDEDEEEDVDDAEDWGEGDEAEEEDEEEDEDEEPAPKKKSAKKSAKRRH